MRIIGQDAGSRMLDLPLFYRFTVFTPSCSVDVREKKRGGYSERRGKYGKAVNRPGMR
jgi:hypothetical protein